MIRRIFRWIFKQELAKLEAATTRANNAANEHASQAARITSILGNIDVSVDVNMDHRSPSWAVVSLQGERTDFIKFIDLGNRDIMEISQFLRRFERTGARYKIDAAPHVRDHLKIRRN